MVSVLYWPARAQGLLCSVVNIENGIPLKKLVSRLLEGTGCKYLLGWEKNFVFIFPLLSAGNLSGLK